MSHPSMHKENPATLTGSHSGSNGWAVLTLVVAGSGAKTKTLVSVHPSCLGCDCHCCLYLWRNWFNDVRIWEWFFDCGWVAFSWPDNVCNQPVH